MNFAFVNERFANLPVPGSSIFFHPGNARCECRPFQPSDVQHKMMEVVSSKQFVRAYFFLEEPTDILQNPEFQLRAALRDHFSLNLNLFQANTIKETVKGKTKRYNLWLSEDCFFTSLAHLRILVEALQLYCPIVQPQFYKEHLAVPVEHPNYDREHQINLTPVWPHDEQYLFLDTYLEWAPSVSDWRTLVKTRKWNRNYKPEVHPVLTEALVMLAESQNVTLPGEDAEEKALQFYLDLKVLPLFDTLKIEQYFPRAVVIYPDNKHFCSFSGHLPAGHNHNWYAVLYQNGLIDVGCGEKRETIKVDSVPIWLEVLSTIWPANEVIPVMNTFATYIESKPPLIALETLTRSDTHKPFDVEFVSPTALAKNFEAYPLYLKMNLLGHGQHPPKPEPEDSVINEKFKEKNKPVPQFQKTRRPKPKPRATSSEMECSVEDNNNNNDNNDNDNDEQGKKKNKNRKAPVRMPPVYHRVNLVEFWCRHTQKNRASKVVFQPGVEDSDCLNLFRPFENNLKPLPEDNKPVEEYAPLIRRHILEAWCNNDEGLNTYVLNWLAFMFQKPELIPGTCLMLRSPEGAGKSIILKALNKIVGRHYLQITDTGKLTGRFNSQLKDVFLLFADEAFFFGKKEDDGILKGMITEPYRTVEAKGENAFNIENHLHLIMASNNPQLVIAGERARRYVVLDVSDRFIGQTEYFKALGAEIEANGPAELYWHLMQRDISQFVPAEIPRTNGLLYQIIMSDYFRFYFYNMLKTKFLWLPDFMAGKSHPKAFAFNELAGINQGQHFFSSDELYRGLIACVKQDGKFKYKDGLSTFEGKLRSFWPREYLLDQNQQNRVFKLAPLSELRRSFAKQVLREDNFDWRQNIDLSASSHLSNPVHELASEGKRKRKRSTSLDSDSDYDSPQTSTSSSKSRNLPNLDDCD